ncbi:MAG: Ig-like domain-containing protein, partial [Candidatus Poribacteria bacterium]
GAIGAGGGADESSQTVTVTAVSGDTNLTPDPTVTETQGVYTLTFAPVADANGSTQVTVTAEDDGPATDPGINTAQQSFTLTVNAVDDAPSFDALGDLTASEGSDAVSVLVTGITVGPDDEAAQGVVSLTAASSDPAIIRTPTVTGSGDTRTITFQPEPDANGVATVTVTLVDGGRDDDPHANTYAQAFDVTVVPVNDTATADATSATTAEDTPVSVALIGSDIDDDTLAFLLWDGQGGVTTEVSSFYGGSVSLVDADPADGQATATYTPPQDFNGDDTFSFVVNDGTLDSATATVTVTVTAVNDAPTATADVATTSEDTSTDVPLAGADVDGDTLTAALWDGSGSVPGPLATTEGGTVTVDQSTARYTPPLDFHGEDTFEFTVTDGALTSDPASVTLTVTAENDAPVANAASATTDEDTATTVSLSGSDLDGDAVTVLLWDGAAAVSSDVVTTQGGTVSVGATSGAVALATYTPPPDYNGVDSFDYVVSDDQTLSAKVTVALTVSAVNDAPEAIPATAQTDEDTTVTVSLTGADVDGDALTVLLWDG